ncbi:MAG: hypothetical protein HRT35_19990 [Algicola sp.]|nr:hypothetical protein [Algicola sp.]
MNNLVSAFGKGMAFACVFCASIANAGEALDNINAQVEEQAAQIDQTHGVLLTSQERDNLKMALIVKKVTTEEAVVADVTVKEKADKAIATYEITDPIEQRKLLIEIEASYFGGSGIQPPCC